MTALFPARRPEGGDALDLAARARRVRVVLTDCDGVLTDGGVYYSEDGEAFKRFNVRDGMGVERLREAGVLTAIVTRELSGTVSRRAAKLGSLRVYAGVVDKAAHLPWILDDLAVGMTEVAYIGDDVNDLGVITEVHAHGLTAAPSDAMPEIIDAVHYRCRRAGGFGAFRDFAEWLLRLRTDSAFAEER
ncbi:MAG TPA: 3-deoxy-D-manno-octulosonate 8-phosphate phosphatase [Vicinamibacteria bacterium]|nr:3-deoxy-D-manno-octulosonate 8-phosphate phosphatase [Vicinamibacteria bacterium]